MYISLTRQETDLLRKIILRLLKPDLFWYIKPKTRSTVAELFESLCLQQEAVTSQTSQWAIWLSDLLTWFEALQKIVLFIVVQVNDVIIVEVSDNEVNHVSAELNNIWFFNHISWPAIWSIKFM